MLERRSMERLYMGVGIGGELVSERLVYQRDVVPERRCARETLCQRDGFVLERRSMERLYVGLGIEGMYIVGCKKTFL